SDLPEPRLYKLLCFFQQTLLSQMGGFTMVCPGQVLSGKLMAGKARYFVTGFFNIVVLLE
ncbi:MAG: hypothetical protein AAFR99_12340, partial [Cyanobacteria bacterium J06629_9]